MVRITRSGANTIVNIWELEEGRVAGGAEGDGEFLIGYTGLCFSAIPIATDIWQYFGRHTLINSSAKRSGADQGEPSAGHDPPHKADRIGNG